MIELDSVCFSYPERPVLNGINLHIGKGEYLGVTGENGSGKTTLAKLLNGLLMPLKGSVTVDGRSTSDRANLLAIRRSVGIVFQNPDAQAIGETVEEDIVFGLENIRVPGSEIDRRIDRYLDMLGIGELRDRNISLLSGGQKQLVNIAAVMAMEPACIVFDEALSMLDLSSRKNVLETISCLNKGGNGNSNSSGTSIVLITHDTADLIQCHRIVVISEGRASVRQSGEIKDQKPGSVMSHPAGDGIDESCRDSSRKSSPLVMRCRHSQARASTPSALSGGIEIRYMSHTYNSGTDWAVHALNAIDLTIGRGVIYGIVGGIGSGKSTLACLIAGLDTPTSGSITIDGMPPKPGMNVGMLFQQPEDFFFEKTIREDMVFGLREKGRGLSGDAIERRIRSAIDEAGLNRSILGKSPFRLSSGEQRLAAFTCTIAMKPGYVILDEPTAGLDRRSREKVLNVIKRMAGEEDVTVVYISHRIRDVLEIAERIAVLEDGNLVFEGTKAMYVGRM